MVSLGELTSACLPAAPDEILQHITYTKQQGLANDSQGAYLYLSAKGTLKGPSFSHLHVPKLFDVMLESTRSIGSLPRTTARTTEHTQFTDRRNPQPEALVHLKVSDRSCEHLEATTQKKSLDSSSQAWADAIILVESKRYGVCNVRVHSSRTYGSCIEIFPHWCFRT